MDGNYDLDTTLRFIDFVIQINKPAFVKEAVAYFRFEEVGKYKGETILMGLIGVYIETEETYCYFDISGYEETYGIERTRKEAEELIVKTTEENEGCNIEKDWIDFWEHVDFDSEEFIRKK